MESVEFSLSDIQNEVVIYRSMSYIDLCMYIIENIFKSEKIVEKTLHLELVWDHRRQRLNNFYV